MPHPDALTSAAATAPTVVPSSRPRIGALDVLRGFALCGILLVNIEPVTHFSYDVPHPAPTLADPSGWLQLLVQQRFFPIFSLLFGMGFSLFLEAASRRTPHPRVLLARRLLVLLPVGLLHQLWHPGEALAPYAVVGLLVLLPATWLPRWSVAAAAAVLVPAAILTGGGLLLIPGMFLLGSALVRYGVADRLESATRVPAALFLAFTVASAPALAAQSDQIAGSGFTVSSAVAGLLVAGAYSTGLLVLLRTPLRPLLQAAFAPLGRMALTNYLTATPVAVAAGHLMDLPHSRSWTTVLLLAAGILLAQWTISTLWLRRFRQGPLEWAWRWFTWGVRPPLAR